MRALRDRTAGWLRLRSRRSFSPYFALAPLVILAACGGATPSAIAGELRGAIGSAKSTRGGIPEQEVEAAAQSATCRGLGHYTSGPATTATILLTFARC